MKKVILGLIALSAVTMAAQPSGMYIVPKVGLDFNADYDNFWSTDGFGGSVGADLYFPMTPMFDLGVGMEFQKHEGVKDYNHNGHHGDEVYNSLPIYGIARFNFPVGGEVKPYMLGMLGMSINTGEYDHGMYFGIGGGIEYQNFNIDLTYKVNNAEHESGWWSADYSRLELGLGYKFGL